MKTIAEIIRRIELKAGSHGDTAQTGSGCFMNVIAYLNCESLITDSSPCVHLMLRRFMIPINDGFVPFGYGPRLIPFIQRAMGTAGMDGDWLLWQLVDMSARQIVPIYMDNAGLFDWAEKLRDMPAVNRKTADKARKCLIEAASSAAADHAAVFAAADHAAAPAAKYAAAAKYVAAEYAAAAAAAAEYGGCEYAAAAAEYVAVAAAAAEAATREQRFAIVEATLDRILPPADAPSQEMIDAAERLVMRMREPASHEG